MLTRTVAMHHVRAALRGAERSGLDAGPLLDRAGISAALLQVEQARVSTDRFAQLIKELWLALDDEFIGSGPGSCRIGTFAMMCHATVHCSRDLRTALRRAAEFYALFPSGPRFRLVETELTSPFARWDAGVRAATGTNAGPGLDATSPSGGRLGSTAGASIRSSAESASGSGAESDMDASVGSGASGSIRSSTESDAGSGARASTGPAAGASIHSGTNAGPGLDASSPSGGRLGSTAGASIRSLAGSGSGSGARASVGSNTAAGNGFGKGEGAGAGAGANRKEQPHEARIEFDLSASDDPDHFRAETLLVVAHRFSGWLIRRRIPLLRVELAYPAPGHVLEYDLLFGAPCRFDAPATAAVFDRALLDEPVLQDEAGIDAFLRRAPQDVLARIDYGSTTATRVRRLLGRSLLDQPQPSHPQSSRAQLDPYRSSIGMLTEGEVAERLAISPQTLRRHLAAEGTGFQLLRDQMRRDHAIAALADGRTPIEQISAQLGFSEPSAFHRAFKRWTGSTPRAYQPGGG